MRAIIIAILLWVVLRCGTMPETISEAAIPRSHNHLLS
jgi:hypothetical protein